MTTYEKKFSFTGNQEMQIKTIRFNLNCYISKDQPNDIVESDCMWIKRGLL